MTDLAKEIHPTVAQWIKKHQPATTADEPRNYYTTNEILAMCHDIYYDESLSEARLYDYLTQSGYEIVDVDGLQRWITK